MPRAPVLRLAGAVGVLLMASVRCTLPLDPEPLQRFDTCEDLQLYLEDQILHPGPVADTTTGGLVGCAASAELVEGGGGEGDKGAANFTTTNTQEVDVDEPDFVKNNGQVIFVLRRGEMVILNAWPADQLAVLSRTTIGGAPFTMLFDDADHTALVVSRTFSTAPQTLVKIFDVEDPAAPRELRSTLIDGDFVDARSVDGKVMLVTRALLNPPAQLDPAPFSDDDNRARLRAAGLATLLPKIADFIDGKDIQPREDQAVACKNTYAPSRSDGHSILLVHGFDLKTPAAPLLSTGVVAGFSHIYASTKSLYLASTETSDGGYFTPPFATTRLHVLDAFKGSGAAEYQATGVFTGRIKDELSLDEGPDGSLRMVITDDAESLDSSAQTTSLVVLQRNGTHLEESARVDDIGRGEAVESVRFLGDRAYVATYPANAPFTIGFDGVPTVPFTDPLSVIDLADPKNPRLRGSIDVGGYSAYIHPLDADHILTVGVDTDPDTGQETALSLLLFDVKDADHPRLLAREDVGNGGTGSQALIDRHAFTYFADQKALGIPLQQFDPNTGVLRSSVLAVFHVDVKDGIDSLGGIEESALFSGLTGISRQNAPCTSVRRSVMMSDPDAGAFVYAISTAGVSVASLAPGLPAVGNLPLGKAGDPVCDPGGGPL